MSHVNLIIIGGLPGTGKSRLGKSLAESLAVPIIDKDTTTRPLVELALEQFSDAEGRHDRHSERYQNTVRREEYRCLLNVAEENLALGISMIVTAPFAWEIMAGDWVQSLNKTVRFLPYDIRILITWLTSPADVTLERLLQRNVPRDHWKLRNWGRYLEIADHNVVPAWADHHLVNDGSRPIQHLVQEMEGWI